MSHSNDPRDILTTLFATIKNRQMHPKDGSYTTSLFTAGRDEIIKKAGEEAVEVVLAASRQSRERLVSELADLSYHLLVLLAEFDLTPDDVFAELERRHR